MNKKCIFIGSSKTTTNNGFFGAISKSLLLGLAAILLCVCSTACTSADKTFDGTNNATNSPQTNSVVKAKVAIPKGLTFTNEMLNFSELKADSDAKSSFRKKEELLDKKAKVDIPQDKIITSADVEKKDVEDDDDDNDEAVEDKREDPPEDKTEAQKKDSTAASQKESAKAHD